MVVNADPTSMENLISMAAPTSLNVTALAARDGRPVMPKVVAQYAAKRSEKREQRRNDNVSKYVESPNEKHHHSVSR